MIQLAAASGVRTANKRTFRRTSLLTSTGNTSMMTRTRMVLKTLVDSHFNNLRQLLARESFIEDICFVSGGILLFVYNGLTADVCKNNTFWSKRIKQVLYFPGRDSTDCRSRKLIQYIKKHIERIKAIRWESTASICSC